MRIFPKTSDGVSTVACPRVLQGFAQHVQQSGAEPFGSGSARAPGATRYSEMPRSLRPCASKDLSLLQRAGLADVGMSGAQVGPPAHLARQRGSCGGEACRNSKILRLRTADPPHLSGAVFIWESRPEAPLSQTTSASLPDPRGRVRAAGGFQCFTSQAPARAVFLQAKQSEVI